MKYVYCLGTDAAQKLIKQGIAGLKFLGNMKTTAVGQSVLSLA